RDLPTKHPLRRSRIDTFCRYGSTAAPVGAAPARRRAACVLFPRRAERAALPATPHVSLSCVSWCELSFTVLPLSPGNCERWDGDPERFWYRRRASDIPRGPVGHDYPARLGRLRLDETERKPLVDAGKERLALAQDNRVNNQLELIDQVLVQKACD